MEFFKIKHDINFMKYSKITNIISVCTFIIAILFLYINGLNLSIEFTGGTLLEVGYSQSVDLAKIRNKLDHLGYTQATVQNFGNSNTVIIRLPNKQQSNEIANKVFKEISHIALNPQIKSIEFVGPEVGEELFYNGLLAMIFVCLGIMLYLAIRFEWRFAVAAVIANLHDIVIILGFFAFFHWEFSLTVLAAILAILGYSVNESVVVFDRIRENFRNMHKADTLTIINNAITTTMSRTIITHLCTQMMVLSMLFFGGASLHNFALALTIGILFGIYSSVLVASPLLIIFGASRKHFLIKKKIKEEVVL